MYEPSQARSSSRFIIQTLLSPRRLKDADRSPSWRIHTVAEPRLGQFKTKNGLLRIKPVATALIHANAEIIPTTPRQHWDSDFLPVRSASHFLPCLFHSHANFHILSRLFFYFCFSLLPASISTFVETRIATGFVYNAGSPSNKKHEIFRIFWYRGMVAFKFSWLFGAEVIIWDSWGVILRFSFVRFTSFCRLYSFYIEVIII